MILGLASHPQSTVKASESSHVSCSGAQRMAAGDIAGPNLTVVCVPRAQFRSIQKSLVRATGGVTGWTGELPGGWLGGEADGQRRHEHA